MKTNTPDPKPKKGGKSLDEEIAAVQEKLLRLQAQKRDQERKALERNQKAIGAFLRAEKLDTVPVERWTAALPALRKLLKVEEGKGGAAPAPASSATPTPARAGNPPKSEQGGGESAAAQPEKSPALEPAT